jgi:hypothetical protein
MLTRRVRRCLLCHHVDVEIAVAGRFVTTTCRGCSVVLRIEFDPPDEPSLKARIERLDEPDSRTPARVQRSFTPNAQREPAN